MKSPHAVHAPIAIAASMITAVVTMTTAIAGMMKIAVAANFAA